MVLSFLCPVYYAVFFAAQRFGYGLQILIHQLKERVLRIIPHTGAAGRAETPGYGESTAEAARPFTFFRLRMAARWVWKVAM